MTFVIYLKLVLLAYRLVQRQHKAEKLQNLTLLIMNRKISL